MLFLFSFSIHSRCRSHEYLIALLLLFQNLRFDLLSSLLIILMQFLTLLFSHGFCLNCLYRKLVSIDILSFLLVWILLGFLIHFSILSTVYLFYFLLNLLIKVTQLPLREFSHLSNLFYQIMIILSLLYSIYFSPTGKQLLIMAVWGQSMAQNHSWKMKNQHQAF